jgi:hypothetical protein
MHCVAARAGQMLGFQMPTSMPYILYGKALKSLQIAISDDAECTESDIYCVTRLLVLYEVSHLYVRLSNGLNITVIQLIGPPDTTRLAHHHRGGIRLVELRGPDCYTSEFDWMLLKSQGPSIVGYTYDISPF